LLKLINVAIISLEFLDYSVDLETETSTETILTQLEFFTDCSETLELRHHDVQFEDIIQFLSNEIINFVVLIRYSSDLSYFE
jgi:hypothetical protein